MKLHKTLPAATLSAILAIYCSSALSILPTAHAVTIQADENYCTVTFTQTDVTDYQRFGRAIESDIKAALIRELPAVVGDIDGYIDYSRTASSSSPDNPASVDATYRVIAEAEANGMSVAELEEISFEIGEAYRFQTQPLSHYNGTEVHSKASAQNAKEYQEYLITMISDVNMAFPYLAPVSPKATNIFNVIFDHYRVAHVSMSRIYDGCLSEASGTYGAMEANAITPASRFNETMQVRKGASLSS
ncbi:hypothetical protein CDES_05780 [Corynebacterium deserti GIMN1.010]|uniref:Secreted protein n=1 Tax=Corynebacterium deserti GIMN1.010 TaxID=931089 RepID=A0A0M5ILW3_9CORY|nr:hypothetical protein [Corynebacterium deserti]ALC05586.1 hypothetical protein CDES_05780 [Corynebacterium deserti GIMN1.010]